MIALHELGFTVLVLAAADSSADAGTLVERALRWGNFDGLGGALLLTFGVLAQLVFFGRWIVQWIASERRQESYMPVLFWWLSLLGASMLLIYFVLRAEPVGILGQSVGWVVYSRNLLLIRANNCRQGEAAEVAPPGPPNPPTDVP